MSSDDFEEEVKPKKSETKKALKKSAGEIKAAKPADGPEPPKTKTGKVAKPPSKTAPAAPAKDDEPAPEKPKVATGKVKKPLGKSDTGKAGAGGGKPKRAPPPAPPAAGYLTNVPANARVVVLAKAWLGDETVRALDA